MSGIIGTYRDRNTCTSLLRHIDLNIALFVRITAKYQEESTYKINKKQRAKFPFFSDLSPTSVFLYPT